MKSLVLLAATIVVLIPAATSLRCHSCTSTTSDLDCYQNRRNEDCYEDVPYECARASYRIVGKKKYYRGCIKKTECKKDEYCKSAVDKTECIIDCCYGDFCNGAMIGTVSGALLTLCVLFASLLCHW